MAFANRLAIFSRNLTAYSVIVKFTTPSNAASVFLFLTLLHANPTAAAPIHEVATDLRVRPCTAQESLIGSSEEMARLIRDSSPEEKLPLSWCEAIDVRWLPDSLVLRFHTSINVDYAWTYTLIRPARDSSMSLVGFGGGLVVGTPLVAAKDVFNGLLDNALPQWDQRQLRSACILYLFLLGRENLPFIRRPEPAHVLRAEDYSLVDRTRGLFRLATLTSRTGSTKFNFSTGNGKLHLNAVTVNADRYPNELKALKLYDRYLTPLDPNSSTGADVTQAFGSYVWHTAGDWRITPLFACKENAISCSHGDGLVDRLYAIEVTPRHRLSLRGVRPPSAFRWSSGMVSEINVICDVYKDQNGLEYWILAKDQGRFKKGDLLQIIYGANTEPRQ